MTDGGESNTNRKKKDSPRGNKVIYNLIINKGGEYKRGVRLLDLYNIRTIYIYNIRTIYIYIYNYVI